MDTLVVAFGAGGQPMALARARSLTVIDGGRATTARPVEPRPVDAGPPTPPERGGGVGSAAREALVTSNARDAAASPDAMTEAKRAQVEELAARDREVRRHEEAHARVGGQYAGQPSYTYQQGPDGKRYAVGGEVSIDVAPIPGDPEATIAKMDVVKRAALAPAEPSGQDRRVAALADAQRLAAMAELADMRTAPPEEQPSIAGLAEVLRDVPADAEGRRLSIAA